MNRYHYRLPMGQVLQDAELLSHDQVRMVLATQAELKQRSRRRSRRFGDLVVEKGWLPPATVDFFAEQYPKLRQAQYTQPLGQYLKAAALMNDDQIRTILTEQDLYGGRFGEIAVTKGWVPKGTIDILLKPTPDTAPNNQKAPPQTINTVVETL